MKRIFLLSLTLALAGVATGRPRTGTLEGTVVGSKDRAVAGASLVYQSADGRSPRAVQCDARGRFYIPYLRAGLYDVRASGNGMSSEWHHNVLVRPGRATTITLRLLPVQPELPSSKQLNGRVREWAIPVADSLPHDPAVDPQGNVWATLMRANQLGRLNPNTDEWKLFPVPTPNAGPHGLVSDPEGNIWFTENFVGKIGRVDARTGRITEYPTPTAKDPHTPIFGPDGKLWFTAQGANRIGRMDTKTGTIEEFRVPTPRAHPYGITVGADGAIWFCEFGANRIGRIDPKTDTITEDVVPVSTVRPRRLVAVGDMLYFTDFHGGRLGRLDITRKSFKLWPSPSGPSSAPYGIAADKGGNIWYEEFRANQLVRFNPQSQTFTRFTLPSPNSEVRNMARDLQGRIWMALSGANKVATID